MLALPAAPALLAQEMPKIEVGVADAGAETVPHFFSAPQLAALRRLSELLLPAMGETPGALEARAPEFLDFLIGESPAERKQLYRAGLDALNAGARRMGKPSRNWTPRRRMRCWLRCMSAGRTTRRRTLWRLFCGRRRRM